MQTRFFILALVAVCGFVVCYFFGFRSGVKQSLLQEDRQGLVVLTLTAYQAAEATNWTKVNSVLSVELLGFTRDYERLFGVPNGTNIFYKRFAEAQEIADRIEKQMVPISSIATNPAIVSKFGTNFTIGVESR